MSAEDAREIEEFCRRLDPVSREVLGKGAMDCTWAELEELGRRLDSDYCRARAKADQSAAAARDLFGDPR